MIGKLAHARDVRAAAAAGLDDALSAFHPKRPIIVACHFDADGLSAAAILVRALRRFGRLTQPYIVGKGETPWSEDFAERIEALRAGGLILCDLGSRGEPVSDSCPTLVIDHHVPTGEPVGAVTISGNGLSPEPTTSLLSWWAASVLGNQSDLLWLAALGLIGDMADEHAFPELAVAQQRWGKNRAARRCFAYQRASQDICCGCVTGVAPVAAGTRAEGDHQR